MKVSKHEMETCKIQKPHTDTEAINPNDVESLCFEIYHKRDI